MACLGRLIAHQSPLDLLAWRNSLAVVENANPGNPIPWKGMWPTFDFSVHIADNTLMKRETASFHATREAQ